MTVISVDHAALETAERNFAARHESLQHVLTTLESGLAPMIGSWEGTAQAMYVEKKQAWDAAAADLAALLLSIKKLTGDAHAGYTQTVAATTKVWS